MTTKKGTLDWWSFMHCERLNTTIMYYVNMAYLEYKMCLRKKFILCSVFSETHPRVWVLYVYPQRFQFGRENKKTNILSLLSFYYKQTKGITLVVKVPQGLAKFK